MTVLLLAVLSLLAGVTTSWLAITRPYRDTDPDARFWFGFTGFCVVAPLLLIVSLGNHMLGALTLAVLVAACLVTGKVANRFVEKQESASAALLADTEHAALCARQNLVLGAWIHYELDVASAIEFPSMHDLEIPEVSALTRALAEAERLRDESCTVSTPLEDSGYRQAVARLEMAFRRAEQAVMHSSETS